MFVWPFLCCVRLFSPPNDAMCRCSSREGGGGALETKSLCTKNGTHPYAKFFAYGCAKFCKIQFSLHEIRVGGGGRGGYPPLLRWLSAAVLIHPSSPEVVGGPRRIAFLSTEPTPTSSPSAGPSGGFRKKSNPTVVSLRRHFCSAHACPTPPPRSCMSIQPLPRRPRGPAPPVDRRPPTPTRRRRTFSVAAASR